MASAAVLGAHQAWERGQLEHAVSFGLASRFIEVNRSVSHAWRRQQCAVMPLVCQPAAASAGCCTCSFSVAAISMPARWWPRKPAFFATPTHAQNAFSVVMVSQPMSVCDAGRTPPAVTVAQVRCSHPAATTAAVAGRSGSSALLRGCASESLNSGHFGPLMPSSNSRL